MMIEPNNHLEMQTSNRRNLTLTFAGKETPLPEESDFSTSSTCSSEMRCPSSSRDTCTRIGSSSPSSINMACVSGVAAPSPPSASCSCSSSCMNSATVSAKAICSSQCALGPAAYLQQPTRPLFAAAHPDHAPLPPVQDHFGCFGRPLALANTPSPGSPCPPPPEGYLHQMWFLREEHAKAQEARFQS